MKKLISLVAVIALTSVSSVYADAANGGTVFKKKGCTACHNPEKDQLAMGLGPSLKMISAAYKAAGGKDAMLAFMGGNDKPIVAPQKYSVMKPQVKGALKKATDAEKGDLADFILSH